MILKDRLSFEPRYESHLQVQYDLYDRMAETGSVSKFIDLKNDLNIKEDSVGKSKSVYLSSEFNSVIELI